MSNRTWHKGPPPHVGWWEASLERIEGVWRWWDGDRWSLAVSFRASKKVAAQIATRRPAWRQSQIEWTDYWPADARVPRIDPRGYK